MAWGTVLLACSSFPSKPVVVNRLEKERSVMNRSIQRLMSRKVFILLVVLVVLAIVFMFGPGIGIVPAAG